MPSHTFPVTGLHHHLAHFPTAWEIQMCDGQGARWKSVR